jgi:hypothetical protein
VEGREVRCWRMVKGWDRGGEGGSALILWNQTKCLR